MIPRRTTSVKVLTLLSDVREAAALATRIASIKQRATRRQASGQAGVGSK